MRDPADRWSPPVIALHWLSGALLIALFAIGFLMAHGPYDAAERFELYQFHKSMGFAALALFMTRGLSRAATTSPGSAATRRGERRAAQVAHVGLYLLAWISILSGWLAVSTAVVRVPTYFFGAFQIPNIPYVGVEYFAFFQWLHFTFVWSLAVLIALHVIAAFKHHLIDQDDTLMRMLPIWRRSHK
jgi:cytochrome b561